MVRSRAVSWDEVWNDW